MVEQQEEKIYEYDVMVVGHARPPIVFKVTKASIANYARSVRCTNPIYFNDAAARREGFEGVIAPPTMFYTYAPVDRHEIMKQYGYIPPTAGKKPRFTPNAGTELVFLGAPPRPGDVITSFACLDKKWETHSGNRFVSWRSVGYNQRGEKVVEYLYNNLWEFSQGQRLRNS